jgi:hypothetical protein
MSWDWNDVEFEKEIDIDVKVDFDFDVDVKVEKETNVDAKVEAEADVDGNLAELILSLEAVGYDTYTQADVQMLTIEDTYSGIELYAISAVG